MTQKTAIIIGAGPAGLTAALELLRKTDILPIIYEESDAIGGISRTVRYRGNRMDIGGHRFFSKSDAVMDWWKGIFPLRTCDIEEAENARLKCMLIRDRSSHILYNSRFFDYPVSLSRTTVANLGLWNMMKIGFSYIFAKILPRKENSLENFMINRFGYELYRTFFKDYTEKVWGVPCHQIGAEWGAQRIKGLSIFAVLKNALKPKLRGIDQKGGETSLITRFLYPPLGPGQLWERVAEMIRVKGGQIHLQKKIVGITCVSHRLTSVLAEDQANRQQECVTGDYFISTMPIRDLIRSWKGKVPENVKEVSEGLLYRDFVTVGLLLNKIRKQNLKDHWIYIQEPSVKMGRLQIFNNWSPFLVADPSKIWLGLEYFCSEGDEIWSKNDAAMTRFAVRELESIGLADSKDVLDSIVIRIPKTYPAYFGAYSRFHEIRAFLDPVENLFLIGRNGMHRYNNMDHSMLTAMAAVDLIVKGGKDKDNLWRINAEPIYHERKKTSFRRPSNLQ